VIGSVVAERPATTRFVVDRGQIVGSRTFAAEAGAESLANVRLVRIWQL
jgi:hypothetical protein